MIGGLGPVVYVIGLRAVAPSTLAEMMSQLPLGRLGGLGRRLAQLV